MKHAMKQVQEAIKVKIRRVAGFRKPKPPVVGLGDEIIVRAGGRDICVRMATIDVGIFVPTAVVFLSLDAFMEVHDG